MRLPETLQNLSEHQSDLDYACRWRSFESVGKGMAMMPEPQVERRNAVLRTDAKALAQFLSRLWVVVG